MKVLRGELRKVVLDDSIAFDPNEARRRLVEINSVVQHDINQDLDAVRRGSRCHCPKLSLASERALNLCEIHRLVAAPPLPHPLVALLRRRDMHMAVTQRSQHRDYLPDVVKAPIEELNDNVAVLGLWDTGCDARHLCAAHTGKQQADFTPIIAAPAVSPFGMPQAPAALRRAVPTRGAFEPTIWHTPSRRRTNAVTIR